MNDQKDQIIFENAHIFWRNFSGKEGRYNPAGRRNFCLEVPEDLAEEMHREGWNVKTIPPRDEDGAPMHYIQVAVAFSAYPPKVWLISGKSKTLLDEDMIASLDYAEIKNVDLIIRPYTWEVRGDKGIKAYLKKLYVTVVQDDLELKYRDILEDDDEVPWVE